ncbi:MAG: amidohydrolase, partial [Gordonibacter sp.]
EAYDRYLANNIYFDMTHPMSWGKDQLECAAKVNGADHLLLGSSFPVFYEWMARSVESVNAMDVSQEDKDLMLGGNAAKLFNL